MTEIKVNDGKKTMLKVFSVAVLSRLVLFLLSFLTLRLSGNGRSIFAMFSESGDVPHYLYIAENWYASSGDKANLIVFYPLYPVLIALFRVVFRSYLLSGIIVSYLSFGVASCYFYKLLKNDYDDKKTSEGMLSFFMASFGVFFISAHTESLFVMLIAMGLYYIREKNWIVAGIVGFFASLTRTQGVLLFLPLAYEAFVEISKTKKFNKSILFALLIPFGYVCYLLLNKAVTGDFLKFLEYQAAAPWYNTSKWVADSLSTSYDVGGQYFTLALIIYWPQIIAFFIAVISIFAGAYKKVPASHLLFIGAYTGATYFHGWMLSGGRYIAACLPIYIVYAAIDNKYIKNVILLLEGIFFLHIAVMWMQGQSIM